MADRVHPADSSPTTVPPPENPPRTEKPTLAGKPAPAYVVQVPKDQIYRIPPPENPYRISRYQKSVRRKNPCCRCLAWSIGIFVILLLLIAVAGGVFYLVVRPKVPKYSVDSMAIRGFNLTQDLTFSPEFNVTVRAENPNKKIGIYYKKGSAVTVSYSNVQLCTGELPAFYQGRQNVTIFTTVLTGSDIRLSSSDHAALLAVQSQGMIPLFVALDVPVRIKVGAVKTWTITVKVRCDVVVNKLAVDSRILSNKCKIKVKP